MICPECKNEIEEGAKTCPACGKALSPEQPEVKSVRVKPAAPTPEERREVRVNAGIYKLICIAMGLCLIAGSVVWATLMLKDRTRRDDPPPASSAPAQSQEQSAAVTTKRTETTTTTTTADPYKQEVAPKFEEDYGTMYVTTDSLVMRIGPGYDYSKCKGEPLASGTALNVTAEQEDAKSEETWCYVTSDGVSGWVCKTYLSSTAPTVTVVKPDDYYSSSTDISVIRYGGVKLYTGPDTTYDVIAELPQGTELEKVGYNYLSVKWTYVKYGEQYGWIETYDGDWFNPTIE